MTPTPEQQHAIDLQAPVIEIRAGAGCGKTTVLLQRAMAEGKTSERVIVLTFSRAAAWEFETRLARFLGHHRPIQTSTIHSMAAEIVHKHGDRKVHIVDEVEAEKLRREALTHHESEEDALERLGLVRYRDLVPMALELLQRRDVLWDYEGAVILIDEAHDISANQWTFVQALHPARLVYVVDLAQRVYGWRGAIEPPAEVVQRAQRVDLTTNFRSLPAILTAANRLDIPGRVDLVGPPGSGAGEVWSRDVESDSEMCEEVAWAFDPAESWAVLTRTRSRALGIVNALGALGIPTHAPGLTDPILDQPHGRAVLDLLHVAQDPMSSVHLVRVLDACGVDERARLRLEAVRTRLACSLWEAVIHQDEYDQLPQLAQDTLRRLWESGGHSEAVDLLTEINPSLADLDVVDVLPAGSVGEVLQWVADPDRAISRESKAGAVYVSTIHGAKGLEFDHVVVAGCEEGGLPLLRKGTDIAEERRLFYVAITRAKQRVILAYRRTDERNRDLRPSRFIREVV